MGKILDTHSVDDIVVIWVEEGKCLPYCGDVKIFVVRGVMDVDEEKENEGVASPIYTQNLSSKVSQCQIYDGKLLRM